MIDVVVVTYNRCVDVIETIQSIQARDASKVIDRLIVVNNASEDETEKLLGELHYDNLEVHNLTSNLGCPGGRNFGIKKASQDIIVLVDDDIEFITDDGFSNIESLFAQEKDLGVLQFQIINHTEQKVLAHEFPAKGIDPQTEESFLVGHFIGAGHVVRKSFIEKVGYYPSDFFYGREELDLSYRMIQAGFLVRYYPSIKLHHKKAPQGRLAPNDVKKHMLRNRLILNYRYLPIFYATINSILWTLKTIKDSGSFTVPYSGILEFFRCRDTYKRTVLTKDALNYLKDNHGRLYF